MGVTIGNQVCGFIDKLFDCLDKLATPKQVRQFPVHYHIISFTNNNGEVAYLIYDFDKKSEYYVYPK